MQRQGQRILIVEDNPDGAESLRMLLSLLGFEVRVAFTGPEGVRVGREWRPDVVLCDIGLPGMDGFGVANALRECRARLVAVTGYSDEATRQRAKQSGFTHFLVKPLDPVDIFQLLALPCP